MEDHEAIAAVLYIVVVVFSAMHVNRDCNRIGEPAFWNVLGTITLWPIFYLVGWLFIWPGSLRRTFSGGSIDDLEQAKAAQRRMKVRARRHG